jgi:hypothetical protein
MISISFSIQQHSFLLKVREIKRAAPNDPYQKDQMVLNSLHMQSVLSTRPFSFVVTFNQVLISQSYMFIWNKNQIHDEEDDEEVVKAC